MGNSSKGLRGNRRRKAGLSAGIVGLSLAGAACAESGVANAATGPDIGNVRTVDLWDEEIVDATLASFHVFDRENPGVVQSGWRVAANNGASRKSAAPTSAPRTNAPNTGSPGWRGGAQHWTQHWSTGLVGM
jgi:hypothetical protein